MADRVLESLSNFQISYEVVECDPKMADTNVFCETYGFKLEESANTIIVASKSDPKLFAACIVLATSKLDVNKKVRKKLGVRKLSFASAEQTQELTGMQIGGVTPLGLPDSLPVWVDKLVFKVDRVIVGGGSRDKKILLASESLLKIPNVEKADISV